MKIEDIVLREWEAKNSRLLRILADEKKDAHSFIVYASLLSSLGQRRSLSRTAIIRSQGSAQK